MAKRAFMLIKQIQRKVCSVAFLAAAMTAKLSFISAIIIEIFALKNNVQI